MGTKKKWTIAACIAAVIVVLLLLTHFLPVWASIGGAVCLIAGFAAGWKTHEWYLEREEGKEASDETGA